MSDAYLFSFSSGNGTEGNPFGISTLQELQNISSNLTAHYTLVNDIDATATRNWNNGSGFHPIGNDTQTASGFQGTPFNGTLDGDGYEIKGLFINRSEYCGLFGAISEGKVLNLTLTNLLVIGGNYTGGIAGYFGISSSKCIIKNCTVSGKISGTSNVGGISGFQSGEVRECTVYGEVRGSSRVGGIAGFLADDVRQCTFNGNVSGHTYSGGIAGIGSYIGIYDCYSRGNISGSSSLGGIMGRCIIGTGYIHDCYSQVNILGSYQIGGIIGTGRYISMKRCGAYDVFIPNQGTSLSSYVGGLCGSFYDGRIEESFSTGIVKGGWRVGGLAGSVCDTSIYDSYSTVDVYGNLLHRSSVKPIIPP